MSVSRVTELKFPICSGDMYSGVPRKKSIRHGHAWSLVLLAIPKSIT